MVGKKTRPVENPYLVFQDARAGWTWKVLKAWQNDNAKPYARWFTAVSSPHTWGGYDMGDTYVADVVLYGRLVEVDGREPTAEELAWADDLANRV